MSFATPRPDMTNRLPKRMVLGKTGKKTGRPPNGLPERIRTIAWFNVVAAGLGVQCPNAIGRIMQKESEARGLFENHTSSKCWYSYAKGIKRDGKPAGLSERRILFVDTVVPGTAEIFQHGPGGLWTALWDDFDSPIFPEDIPSLLMATQADINFVWLARVVIGWRKRMAIGWPNNSHAPDGLYEAIHAGLTNESIKLVLLQLGVLDLIKENIQNSERENIQRDPDKHQEIECIGRLFSNDPIDLYISNPIGFWLESMKINSSPGQ